MACQGTCKNRHAYRRELKASFDIEDSTIHIQMRIKCVHPVVYIHAMPFPIRDPQGALNKRTTRTRNRYRKQKDELSNVAESESLISELICLRAI